MSCLGGIVVEGHFKDVDIFNQAWTPTFWGIFIFF